MRSSTLQTVALMFATGVASSLLVALVLLALHKRDESAPVLAPPFDPVAPGHGTV